VRLEKLPELLIVVPLFAGQRKDIDVLVSTSSNIVMMRSEKCRIVVRIVVGSEPLYKCSEQPKTYDRNGST